MTMTMGGLRRVLITGGARGIGAAIASEFKSLGAQVFCPSRQELDLRSRESLESFCRSLVEGKVEKGPFDVLINNAGVNYISDIEKIREDQLEEMMAVNLMSPLRLIRALAPDMKTRGWGRIVNVSSVLGIISRPRRSVYSSTKSGINGLTRAAAVELGPYNILVNSICPGYINTELTAQNNSPADIDRIKETIPLRRLANPEEVAKLVTFLCSESNTYITGQSIAIDGGLVCQ